MNGATIIWSKNYNDFFAAHTVGGFRFKGLLVGFDKFASTFLLPLSESKKAKAKEAWV